MADETEYRRLIRLLRSEEESIRDLKKTLTTIQSAKHISSKYPLINKILEDLGILTGREKAKRAKTTTLLLNATQRRIVQYKELIVEKIAPDL